MAWKTFKYSWNWQLKSSPRELWPYAADTQRFNQAARLPVVEYTETPLETGGSRRTGRMVKFGIPLEWEEYPFEWVREQEYSVLRVYSHGPLARMVIRVVFEPNAGGTLLRYITEVTPANLLGFPALFYMMNWEARRNFERTMRQIDEAVQNPAAEPFDLPVSRPNPVGQARLEGFSRELLAQGFEPRWVDCLVDLVSNEADLNVARLRPYVLAEAWQAPRRAILEMFLSAAKLGMLVMRWDVLCPLCRGSRVSPLSLSDLSKEVHCPTCNIDYEANFSRNVELTFRPHPQIRPVADSTYCIGGPMVTPHILLHQLIEPGQSRTLALTAEPGGYHLRTQRPQVEAWVNLEAARSPHPARLAVVADEHNLSAVLQPAGPEDRSAASPLELQVSNAAAIPQSIFVERADWYTAAATAAEVTTLQHFRDLFSDEVLRPGEEIGVQGMTILFSDLVGSTAMYNRRGDAPSYALVREQFDFLQRVVREYEGGIVKTIGDAIMAAFVDPARAVASALTIQGEVEAFNASHPDEPLKIKLGLHSGPCIAVNLNGRLDYFGTTVNLAARLEGQSRGGDVVISERLWQDPAVQRLLETLRITATRYETAIKGFDERFALYRLELPGPAGPELAYSNNEASRSTLASMSSPK